MPEQTPTPSSDLRSALEASKKRRRTTLFSILGVATVAVIAGGIALGVNLGSSGDATASDRLHLKIATSEDNSYTDAVTLVAAEKGLDIDWINVDDWVLPNTELVAGQVDGNSFQHLLYMSNFNVANNADLKPQFSTLLVQWGIFSATLDSVADIGQDAHIAIPDDPANGGRALYIAESAGLITIADDATALPTIDDIESNPLNLTFVPIAAVTIPQQFTDPSLSAAIIGASYFDPKQGITNDDALYLDDPNSENNLPYTNVITSRSDNLDNPAWAVLEESYADPRVSTAVEEEWHGETVLVEVPLTTLNSTLTELENIARAAS